MEDKMSTSPTPPALEPLPDFLQTHESVTLDSIRKAKTATVRGKDSPQVRYDSAALELEAYLNFTTFDLSGRIDRVERYLKNEERLETAPPEIVSEFMEMLRDLKLCGDIAHFAISQLTHRTK